MNERTLKVALVIHRFGEEIRGGAEYLAYELVNQLSRKWNVDVLTTCAEDYVTWENKFAPGTTEENGYQVHRFPTEYPRKKWSFRVLNRILRHIPSKWHPPRLYEEWINAQGPYCPSLLNFIQSKAEDYDLFIFITYLYYPTIKGLPLVKDKAILIGTAHDEPEIKHPFFKEIYQIPRGLIFLTPEERNFVHRQFHNQDLPNTVRALGIDIPSPPKTNNHASDIVFRNYLHKTPYMFYIGRIDQHKGCADLFSYFISYKKQYPSNEKLVVAGPEIMKVPLHPDILYLGLVSQEEKWELYKHMTCLAMPSKFESLSIVLLEAWKMNKPVIVNQHTPVLKGHVDRSQGGVCYVNKEDFIHKTKQLFKQEKLAKQWGRQGKSYVDYHFTWEHTLAGYDELVSEILPN